MKQIFIEKKQKKKKTTTTTTTKNRRGISIILVDGHRNKTFHGEVSYLKCIFIKHTFTTNINVKSCSDEMNQIKEGCENHYGTYICLINRLN
jgi:hypothetical protein